MSPLASGLLLGEAREHRAVELPVRHRGREGEAVREEEMPVLGHAVGDRLTGLERNLQNRSRDSRNRRRTPCRERSCTGSSSVSIAKPHELPKQMSVPPPSTNFFTFSTPFLSMPPRYSGGSGRCHLHLFRIVDLAVLDDGRSDARDDENIIVLDLVLLHVLVRDVGVGDPVRIEEIACPALRPCSRSRA